jgi:hypothetical protein
MSAILEVHIRHSGSREGASELRQNDHATVIALWPCVYKRGHGLLPDSFRILRIMLVAFSHTPGSDRWVFYSRSAGRLARGLHCSPAPTTPSDILEATANPHRCCTMYCC